MKKIITNLEQDFFDNLPQKKTKRIILPYQDYRIRNKKHGHNQIILDLIHDTEPIPTDKNIIIQKILEDCASLYHSLLPLYKIGIHFSLSLAGGAVRDLLLNEHNHIKDLDIILSIDINQPLYYKLMYQELEFDVFNFPWFAKQRSQQLQSEPFLSNYMTKQKKIYELIKFIINKKHTFEQCYSPHNHDINHELQKSEYISRNLNGVLKINTSTLHYPIDILLTHVKSTNFINAFDFNICKTSINLIYAEKTIKHKFHFPQNEKEFLQQYIPDYDFLEDVKNKHITMDTTKRSVKDIEISINDHLPRLETKFPGYTVQLLLNEETQDNSTTTLEESTISKKSLIRHYYLAKKLKSFTTDTIISKHKI
jgi:hypothetical protein